MNNRDLLIESACHSAWYAYAVLANNEEGKQWRDAPKWQKDSMKNAIVFWDKEIEKLRHKRGMTNFKLYSAAYENLPELSHINWMKFKKLSGWVYGPEKDEEKKTHPCMMPYKDLPLTQKAKDKVVIQAYLNILLALGEI